MKVRLAIALSLFSLALTARADVIHLTVDDMIHPISDEYIGRGIDLAAANHADAVLIELRTPGGLSDSMRAIVEKIVRSPSPVIVYVAPSGSYAASAGFVILESADVAAMAPGTNAGAAHPVLLNEKMDDVMKTKLENDAAAFIRSIAAQRGRNVAVAESAVRQSHSFTEREALDQHLIDLIAPDVPALLHALDGKTIRRFNGTSTVLHISGKPVTPFGMTLREKILSWIMDPNVAFILFALGGLALWTEFSHPGAVVPGVVGLIAILLSVFALNLLPTRFAAMALLLAAFVLFGLEAKFATHGVLGVGGIVCMVLGAVLLVDGPIPQMRVQLLTAFAVSIPIGAIAIFLMTLALRARGSRVATGREGMIGEIGIARTDLQPEGKVFVHGELWNAASTHPLPSGARVRIKSVEGLRLVVDPEETPAQEASSA